jgi:hypothetical protein
LIDYAIRENLLALVPAKGLQVLHYGSMHRMASLSKETENLIFTICHTTSKDALD